MVRVQSDKGLLLRRLTCARSNDQCRSICIQLLVPIERRRDARLTDLETARAEESPFMAGSERLSPQRSIRNNSIAPAQILQAYQHLAWMVGEVRRESRWLRTLVQNGRAIPFGLGYFHPWMSRRSEGRYILYRETVADTRPELSRQEVANLLYAIWRRTYRIPYPLQSDTFCYMMDQLEGRESIGVHSEFASTDRVISNLTE